MQNRSKQSPGGPFALVTNRCVFAFDKAARRFNLASVHPEESLDSITEHTGFEFTSPPDVAQTPAPTDTELALLRGAVGEEVAEVYPAFAERVWNIRQPTAKA